jgi:hypothetical protein
MVGETHCHNPSGPGIARRKTRLNAAYFPAIHVFVLSEEK